VLCSSATARDQLPQKEVRTHQSFAPQEKVEVMLNKHRALVLSTFRLCFVYYYYYYDCITTTIRCEFWLANRRAPKNRPAPIVAIESLLSIVVFELC
jgi:hypothetical protein